MSTVCVAAQPSVKVMALFSNKAMLQINGKNHVMNKGDRVNGVTLISANGRQAKVRFDNGLEKPLGLNQSIQQGYKKPTNKKLTLYANKSGMFNLAGRVNGQRAQFLVDTGATFVAISSVEAEKLNLSYINAPKGMAKTANEIVPVWNITLDSVTVGNIKVPQVKAVVLKGDLPRPILLGMSFLEHLKMERNGSAMVLEQKFK